MISNKKFHKIKDDEEKKENHDGMIINVIFKMRN